MTPEEAVFAEVDGFDESEKGYIKGVGAKLQALASEMSAVIDSFKSNKAVWGISKYIEFFDAKRTYLNETIVSPLQQQLVARQTRSNSAVYKALEITQEIANELDALFMQVRQTLTHPANRSKALTMTKALDDQKNRIIEKITQFFEPKLIELSSALNNISNTQELSNGLNQMVKMVQKAKKDLLKPATNAEKVKIVGLVEAVLRKG